MHKTFAAGLAFLLTSGCASVSPWKIDSIATGTKTYDSARLTYKDPSADSRISYEFIRTGTAVDFYLNLAQYSFTPSSRESETIVIRYMLGDDPPFEETVPLLEGRMRLHIPQDTASRITSALKMGREVSILVDGFEGKLQPESFAKSYDRFMGSAAFFKNPFKGPLE